MRKKQLLRDRRALLDEIAALQAENLRLRLGEPPEAPAPDSPEEEAAARPGEFSRFPLLRAVDEKYENAIFDGPADPKAAAAPQALPQIAEHLRRYAAAHFGLYAGRPLFACFLGAMAASDFLLLRGDDGGLGPLAFCRAVAAAWGQDIEIAPVEGGDLLGGPDPAARRYRETQLLRAVYEAGYREGVSFAVLEGVADAPERRLSRLLPLLALSHNAANLARQITLADSAWPGDPVLLQNGALPWPGNLWVIGALPPGSPALSPQLRAAAMEFCLPGQRGAKAFLTPLEHPAALPARQLRGLFAHAREVYALPEETLRLYALVEQHLAEHMELSLGAQSGAQLRAFGSVCLACGLRPAEALDGFFCHKAMRRLEYADAGALKYELPGLRRFLAETFGRRALPLTSEYLEFVQNDVGNATAL
ncbi:MAG: hypothetical protein LBB75_07605 [Oscillospiraceae bacterium]|jgi:hypothetical protein|nr:hypothetical protein [Oscillospiraceae bacterium]